MDIDAGPAPEAGAAIEPFRFSLTSINFNDGTSVEIGRDDLVVIVGGNNTGKSQTLRDIALHFRSPNISGAPFAGTVVTDVKYSASDDPKSAELWLSELGALTDDPGAQGQMPSVRGTLHPRATALEWFKANPTWKMQLFGVLCIELLDTETRLTTANPPASISYMRREPVTHPIQQLYRRTALELEISEYFKNAFGVDVIVNHGDGNSIPLHCGNRPPMAPDADRISEQYLDKLAKIPLVHQQGDGMRSFLGTVLRIFVWKPFVTLLDEPEAFLHPPQARYMGSLLAKKKPANRQVIVSTHSGDFLRGVLDANNANVKIIRLTRDGQVNHPVELSNAELAKVWRDPLIRHSNLLDGVFHDGVVLCEADTDCQFYASILEELVQNKPAIRRPHLLFAHVGGKDRFRTVVPALRCLGVPVHIIADFDILSAEHPLRSIAEGMGGHWGKIERDFKILLAAMKGQKKELSKVDVQQQIVEILAEAGDVISEQVADRIREVIKRGSPWALAKLAGKSFVPPGDATQAYIRLQVALAEIGLHVVEVGEMECFCKSIGGHGTKWVNAVMERDLANDPELRDAREFVASIWPLQ